MRAIDVVLVIPTLFILIYTSLLRMCFFEMPLNNSPKRSYLQDAGLFTFGFVGLDRLNDFFEIYYLNLKSLLDNFRSKSFLMRFISLGLYDN